MAFARLRGRVCAAALASVLICPPGAGGQIEPTITVAPGHGAVTGTVTVADGSPLPQARVRLREVTTGRATGSRLADANGRFVFDRVLPGSYLPELVDERDAVVAVGPMFTVGDREDVIATFIRLPGRVPWARTFFTSAAVAALATAASLGITAAANGGQPASPRQ